MKRITALFFTVSLILSFLCACAENKELSEEDKNLYTSNTEIVKVDSINDLEFDKIVKLTDNVSGHIYTTEDSQKITKLINIIKKAKINNDTQFPVPDGYYPQLFTITTYNSEQKMYEFRVCGYKGEQKLNVSGYGVNFYCDLSDEGADDFYKLYMEIYHETIDKETMPSTVSAVNSVQDNNANSGDKNESSSLPLETYILKSSTEITKPTVTLSEGNEFKVYYSPISSYLPYGHYEINGDELQLLTDDNEYKFVFTIKDKDKSLVFNLKASKVPADFENVEDKDVFSTKN